MSAPASPVGPWAWAQPATVTTRLCAAVVWALVVASAVLWGVRLLSVPAAVPASVAALAAPQPGSDAFSRLLGQDEVTTPAAPQPTPAASRFQLSGVVAPTVDDDPGIALIAIDGQRPRAFRTGDAVDAGYRLDKVSHRGVVLLADDGTATVVLEMATPEAGLAPASPPVSGATTITRLPATPGAAAVRPDSPVVDPGPPPVPAVDLAQEATARPSASAPNALSPGRRKRLRGLAH